MSTGADISALYREFTDALRKSSRKPQATRHVVADSQERALPSKNTLPTASMNIF